MVILWYLNYPVENEVAGSFQFFCFIFLAFRHILALQTGGGQTNRYTAGVEFFLVKIHFWLEN